MALLTSTVLIHLLIWYGAGLALQQCALAVSALPAIALASIILAVLLRPPRVNCVCFVAVPALILNVVLTIIGISVSC